MPALITESNAGFGGGPRRLWFLALIASVGLISVLHYITSFSSIALHELFQRLYYVPIVTAAVLYGVRGGLALAGLSAVLYVPHVALRWHAWPVFQFDQYAEIVVFTLVAMVTGLLADRLRAERDRCRRTAIELDETCRQLETSIDERLRAERFVTIGRLASGIAHEIRTPLGGLLGSLEILGADIPPDDPKIEFMGIAKRQLERLNKTVVDFLDLACPPAVAVRPAPLKSIIEAAVRLATPSLTVHGGSVSVDVEDDAPFLHVDVDQLERALVSILLEECHVRRPVHLTLAASAEDEMARITVSVPLARGEVRNAVDRFEPFSGSDANAGLTLAIARRLIENQGGVVRAEATAGTFRYLIDVPLVANGVASGRNPARLSGALPGARTQKTGDP